MRPEVTISLKEYNGLLNAKNIIDKKDKIIFHSVDGCYEGFMSVDDKFKKKAKEVMDSIINDNDYYWAKCYPGKPKAGFIKNL